MNTTLLRSLLFASVILLALSPSQAGEGRKKSRVNESTTARQSVEMNKESFAGIGAVLQKTNDQIVISRAFPDSPAEKAGLRMGQAITAINAIPTAPMALEDAVKLIRGPKGTEVELTVADLSAATTRRVTIVRDTVEVTFPDATGRVLDGNVGLLTVPCFSEATPKLVAGILQSFASNGAQGVVMDLRNNGGGSLRAVIDVAGLFVGKERTLFLVRKTTAKEVQTFHGTGDALWRGPLVALVDGTTASGGELVASALKTCERAKVVGQKTYGQGASRTMEPQPDGTSKIVVVAHFLTAAGDPIDGNGIKPDVTLDASLSKDEALRKAVEVLSRQ